ncbi:MAG: Lrp/AsnC family transcriptional regulator [Candidatus Eremiobacteraeota bacterium]|nr:Lrp/AsnC family transcriptional regulator [Candidatus Eremiobacteraeota bacterium]MBV8497980.1 Lrp/AsnC family transcriptional regulator [Candidatus Eremiobacteraeota bacterium]
MTPEISEAPATISDPVNAAILAVSEDRLAGFQTDPFGEIASRTGIPVETVMQRIVTMLRAGTIRRVRQTLLSTSLAQGALCAWEVAPERLDAAFDFMFREDPFSGHVVIRTTDAVSAGSKYRLWTTLKVPQGYSLRKHAEWLRGAVGAQRYRLMPARMLFALGVGHVRRRGLEPGARSQERARPMQASVVELSDLQWRVLVALKREFAPGEILRDVWSARARDAGLDVETFVNVARSLQERRVIGRFSTFLEHVKPTAGNERATRYNALFHWAVPAGREIDAGSEVARHYVITHAYWREGGPEFHGVNIMAVAHGMEKERVLAHKAAIDEHLREAGIGFSYTNVFWGGRSEIKPSEIAPDAYRSFCASRGIDPETMRTDPKEGASG